MNLQNLIVVCRCLKVCGICIRQNVVSYDIYIMWYIYIYIYTHMYIIYVYIYILNHKNLLNLFVYSTAFPIIYGWAGICNRQNVVSSDIHIMW